MVGIKVEQEEFYSCEYCGWPDARLRKPSVNGLGQLLPGFISSRESVARHVVDVHAIEILDRLGKIESRLQKIVNAFPYNFNQESFWRD